jgi:Uma2 family endonuclease
MTGQERLLWDANEYLGLRLEGVGGLPVWEGPLFVRHQRALNRVQRSLRSETGASTACVHAASVFIRFPDGSLKRPDLAVFPREPDEQETAVTLLPEAVIEILSRGYEAKDLEVGVPFYQRMNVKDIVVLDPDTDTVLHYQADQPTPRQLVSPVDILLACGYRCTV